MAGGGAEGEGGVRICEQSARVYRTAGMVKSERRLPSPVAPDDDPLSGRVAAIANSAAADVREQAMLFAAMPSPHLLAQLTGTAARLQVLAASSQFGPVSARPCETFDRRSLENTRDTLSVLLLALTAAISTFIALERELDNRQWDILEELETARIEPASRRRRTDLQQLQ